MQPQLPGSHDDEWHEGKRSGRDRAEGHQRQRSEIILTIFRNVNINTVVHWLHVVI